MANPIHAARPKLKEVAPLTYSNVVLFIWLNLFIAYSFYVGRPNATLVVVTGVFNTYFWTGVFIFLSLAHLYSVVMNDWKMVRRVLICGLFAKVLITYALIVLGFRSGFSHTVGVTSLWVGIAWVQFFTVRYFDKSRLYGGK